MVVWSAIKDGTSLGVFPSFRACVCVSSPQLWVATDWVEHTVDCLAVHFRRDGSHGGECMAGLLVCKQIMIHQQQSLPSVLKAVAVLYMCTFFEAFCILVLMRGGVIVFQ